MSNNNDHNINVNETAEFIKLYINSTKVLTSEERLELFKKKANGDLSAREKLFDGNIKLILKIINENVFSKFGNKDDLFQVGCQGLLKAIDGFDLDRKNEFSTYALKTIRGTILNYINNDNLVHINRSVKNLVIKVNQYKNEFFAKNHREATKEEIAKHFGVEESIIVDAENALSPIYIVESNDNNHENKTNGFDAFHKEIHDYENRFDSFSVKTVDAYLDLTRKLQITDKFDPDNKQFNEQDATKNAIDSFESKIKNKTERELLNENPINWLSNWIIKAEKINPNRYYNRLIAKVFPDKDFAKEASPDFYNLSRETITKRNSLIREAIQNNMKDSKGNPITQIEISTRSRTKIYNNIENELIRDDRLFRVDDVRNIVFLIALAFNLDYDTMEELLVHCLGERKIDFKNPYEVILSYCLIQDRPSCEHYIELIQKYKEMDHSLIDNDAEYDTFFYEDEFWELNNDKDLLNYIKSLPENNSQSARTVLQQTIDEIQAELLKNDEELYYVLDAYLDPEVDPKIKESLKGKIGVEDTNIVNVFIDPKFSKARVGLFKFLRKKVFNTDNLRNVLFGNELVTKEYLLVALFFRYCLSDKYAKLKEELKSDDSNKFVKKIYQSFKGFANPKLEEAGFDFIYLPAPFESFLMYCLVSDGPLETFKQIMMYKG